ncbi:helix-turn-helix domain-containing protein [Enterococcus sp. 669A]|uniref:Helix-turn-helix domain-containing protein n=1 Tax=Candidatus Enterococcus moelleringii TaxID=2815325 RepID=A0ABS3L4H5_9ENTE|nr:helix-turn-helix domain-containing protein [Enterococcus sp. 669A]
MDQAKIGKFFKVLRMEKQLTQEQFAEIMSVSNRTVSRWETGANMPDLDVLIQIADYYEVEIAEIIDGERKSEKMNEELKETTLKVADYSNEERKKLTKRMHILFLLGAIASALFIILDLMGVADTGFTETIASFALGFSFGMLVVGVIVTSQYMIKIRKFKQRLLNR